MDRLTKVNKKRSVICSYRTFRVYIKFTNVLNENLFILHICAKPLFRHKIYKPEQTVFIFTIQKIIRSLIGPSKDNYR